MKNNQHGFSLIELLIVVVILGIVAAVAIPNLVASRRSANQAGATSAVRTLTNAQFAYYATAGENRSYGTMPELRALELIDENLGAATSATNAKSGYYFTINTTPYTAPTLANFIISGNPSFSLASGLIATGTQRFCQTSDGILRSDSLAPETIVETAAQCVALAPAN